MSPPSYHANLTSCLVVPVTMTGKRASTIPSLLLRQMASEVWRLAVSSEGSLPWGHVRPAILPVAPRARMWTVRARPASEDAFSRPQGNYVSLSTCTAKAGVDCLLSFFFLALPRFVFFLFLLISVFFVFDGILVPPHNALFVRSRDRERSCCAPRLQGGVKERNKLRFIPIREAPRRKAREASLHFSPPGALRGRIKRQKVSTKGHFHQYGITTIPSGLPWIYLIPRPLIRLLFRLPNSF